MKTIIAIALTASCLTVSAVEAAGINQRQAAQRDSIRAGVADGSLTQREAHRLGKQQIKFERKEQRYRSDGELTRKERVNLQTTADRNRANIYRQRHDAQLRTSDE